MKQPSSASRWQPIWAAFAGNPVATKDAVATLRPSMTFALAAIITVAVMFFTAVVLDVTPTELARWGDGVAKGQELFAVLLGGVLLLQAVFLPPQAASAIAMERQRGTWQPLITTALTPWDIAIGKVLGVYSLALLSIVLIAPALALCALAGDIGPVEVLLGLVACAVHGFTQASVGLYGGARAEATKSAVSLGLLLAIVAVTLPLLLPFLSFVALSFEPNTGPYLFQAFTAIALLALLLSAASLVGVRGWFAPRADARRSWRTGVALLGLGVVPAVLGLSFLAGPPPPVGEQDIALLYGLFTTPILGAIAALVVMVELASVPGDATTPLDAPSTPRAMLRALLPVAVCCAIIAVVGSVLADGLRSWPTSYRPMPNWTTATAFPEFVKICSAAWLFYAGVAGVTALVARVVSHPWRRVGLALFGGAAVLGIPLVGLVITDAFSLGSWAPLIWLNPVGVLGDVSGLIRLPPDLSLEGPFGLPAWIAGSAVWLALAVAGWRFGPRAR